MSLIDLVLERIISNITWVMIRKGFSFFLLLFMAAKVWARTKWFRWKWKPTDEDLVYLLDLLGIEKSGGRRFGYSPALKHALLSQGVTEETMNAAGLPVIVVSGWAKRKLKGYSANSYRVH
jgi:hypothetical protein